MNSAFSNWRSYWDIMTPQQAAMVLVAHFGDEALKAVRLYADNARVDRREDDIRFWRAVLDAMGHGSDATADLEDQPATFPIPPEWQTDEYLRKIGPENCPLDASILAALTLRDPQDRLSRLEAEARREGRRAEARFWQRAQHWLIAILTPSDDCSKPTEKPVVH